MNLNRPLMPGFLKRAEHKLLLNNPLIWSTRVHLVLYYGILFNLLLAGICFLEPSDLRFRSKSMYWVSFVIIIAIIGLTVWLIYLLRFNVFKKYGNIKPLHGLVTFLFYFISAGMIVLSVFVYPIVECVRANRAFSDKELVGDINTINLSLAQLNRDSLNIRKYYYSDLEFVSSYWIDEHMRKKVLGSDEIRDEILRYTPTAAELADLEKEYYALRNKYAGADEFPYNNEVEMYAWDSPVERVRKRYKATKMIDNIGRITEKKYSFSGRELSWKIRAFYYFTLGITLLVFCFRQTTVRTFFLSLLSGVLLGILTVLIMAFGRAELSTVTGWMICYALVFFAGSLFTIRCNKRKALNGIFINLFVFIIPVFPLLVVSLIYELTKYNRYKYVGTGKSYMEEYFRYAEIGGPVLLLILLATFIHKIYRHWYSLPEN
ncbi:MULTISPECIES: hypothetical protein [Niastella]|uniref:DUF805 domain-containing protein n=1 Tax=Niastella soli TaxID=2821487 RepID=A0ABS3Z3Z5_9BACT|nr:hypothetical protein [Niastella soli]MBO9204763.1 hypothetical protein [Niastella soli]